MRAKKRKTIARNKEDAVAEEAGSECVCTIV